MTTETETVADVVLELEHLDYAYSVQLRDYAQRIAAAHAREVGELEKYKADTQQLRDILGDSPAAKLVIELDQLRQANIAYSSENANLRGRAMAAENWAWATGDTMPPPNTDVIGVWASRDEFPPEVELCGVPTAGNPERSWFNAYGICTPPDRWIHVPSGTWNSRADAAMGEPVREVIR